LSVERTDDASWESPELREVGDLHELVLGGVAKTGAKADPGDPGKPPGQEEA
jgi:hypothetical protein